MPKPTPLSSEQRNAIADDIRAGMGRNAIARKHGVSAGSVTSIARQENLFFDRCVQTATASHARQIDQWKERVDRADELLSVILNAPRRQNGTETRAERRASYALYDLDRHHNGRYLSW